MPVWVWGWLEAFRFFRWCPDWMLPILNNDQQSCLGLEACAWSRIPDLKARPGGNPSSWETPAWQVSGPWQAPLQGLWEALEIVKIGLLGPGEALEKERFEGCIASPQDTLFQGRPDGSLASGLPGLPRSPQLPVGTGSSVARRRALGCLACRLRRVRPARRPRAHSVWGLGFGV